MLSSTMLPCWQVMITNISTLAFGSTGLQWWPCCKYVEHISICTCLRPQQITVMCRCISRLSVQSRLLPTPATIMGQVHGNSMLASTGHSQNCVTPSLTDIDALPRHCNPLQRPNGPASQLCALTPLRHFRAHIIPPLPSDLRSTGHRAGNHCPDPCVC